VGASVTSSGIPSEHPIGDVALGKDADQPVVPGDGRTRDSLRLEEFEQILHMVVG
jgi:hypothetical protein